MKEFAGIPLTGLSIDSSFDRHNAHRVFLQHYKNNYLYDDTCGDPGIIIQAVEHCIQANLSLPITSDEALAITLEYLPDDSHLKLDTTDNIIIRALKLALTQHGFAEDNYKSADLRDRCKIIPLIKDRLTMNKDWMQTVSAICHAVSKKNLDIAAEHLNEIVYMHNHDPQPISDERLAIILGLQISHCISITSYLQRSMGVLHAPFYNQYQALYIEFMQKLYNVAQSCLDNSLKRLKAMPEPVNNTGIVHGYCGMLTLFKRNNGSTRVENSGYTVQHKI